MLVPEYLWQPSAKDAGSLLIETLFRQATLSDAVATINLTVFTVPADRLLLMLTANATGDGGGATNLSTLAITVREESGPAATVVASLDRGAAAETNFGNFRRDLSWSGQVWVPPSGQVRVFAVFDSGLSTNNATGNLTGILLPKGQVR